MSDEEVRSDPGAASGPGPTEPERTEPQSTETVEQPETAEGAERQAGAWDDVSHALNDLGEAVTTWAAAFRDDPETRRHASELKDGFERLGRQMGDALDSVSGSDFGRSVTQAAGRAGAAMGDVARKAGDQVSPFVVSTLRGASEGIHRAADRLDKRGSEVGSDAAPSDASETSAATAEAAEAPEAPVPPVPPAPSVPQPPEGDVD